MDRVVFFGSGPVAAKSLELLNKNFEIEAVVTKPKPSHHHGNFPVLDLAERLNIPIKTVSNKSELDSLIATNPFNSAAGVLIDFGIIVSQKTIDYFAKGIVNSHFSLLPELRGADPITFAVLSGQKQTGVSLMLLVEKMDEGPLIACGIQKIDAEDTTPSLTAKLIALSNALLKEELPRYMKGETKPMRQEELGKIIDDYPTTASYSRKLTKEDGRIDWNKPTEVLEREIRAYIEWPKSYTTLADKDVIVTEAHAETSSKQQVASSKLKPGKVFLTEDKELLIQTGDGLLIIDYLKPAGKKTMTAKEFLSGYGKNL